jgi:hypothetical protein
MLQPQKGLFGTMWRALKTLLKKVAGIAYYELADTITFNPRYIFWGEKYR